MKNTLLSLTLAASILLSGCATTQSPSDIIDNDVIPNLPVATSTICLLVMNAAIHNEADRQNVANQMYVISKAVYTTTGGTLPTPDEFNKAIVAFGGSNSQYTSFASTVSNFYAGFYPSIKGDVKRGILVLNGIAQGCYQASNAIVSQSQPAQ